MNTFISLIIAVMISGVQTVNQYYFNEGKEVKTEQIKTSSETNTSSDLTELKKDPLYPFIDKQNKIKTKNGIKYIENEDNLLVLANKEFSLQPTYVPQDLTRPHVAFSFGDQKIEKAQMRKPAAQALEAFFKEAKESGHELYAVSGYRSYKRQQEVFDAEVAAKGDKLAREAVAYPGTSEHQTGLAMDISSKSQGFNLTAAFGDTPEGKWARENAAKYGFILRYMKGRENVTQYEYEAWHFRYVGKEAAKIIYANNWTLEEFFKHVAALDKKVKQAEKK